ncbi:LRP2 [Acanthosepion pharaonis]|uniref:LRP2 n=1 Tax=Acanthosepion pharaonis TaxID=158019 RepID=A0A812ASW2_ACAPH|nr:LRP2 [Sepia pharaonis]
MDIHILHPLKQKPHPNPCGMDNGGCSHLCLLAPGTKYRCVCPSNFFLSSDNRTCIANCSSSQFRCGITDDRCIPLLWKCDGEKDCKDGLDELDCRNSPDMTRHLVSSSLDMTRHLVSSSLDMTRHLVSSSLDMTHNTTCKPSQFTCANGACISIMWKCDYDQDCVDGSDESPDLNCANKTCPLNWFKCATNYKCVPRSYLCDGEDDCRDNSDEASENCGTCNPDQQFQCDNNRCIPKRWVCDFDNDCKDGSDEKLSLCQNKYRSCSESEFQCRNKKCIQGKWRCDYDNDCGDESDEINCGQITCPVGKFRCNNGYCVHQSAVCDGHRDCQDVSDELNCTARFHNGKYCPANVFECKNTICIPRKWQCDGVDDCGDNSDEAASVCKETECSPDTHFRCDNFICIPRWRVCDKVDNCGDASDEKNFEICEPVKRRCEANQFKCSTRKQCIHSSKVCDDIIDCEDSSDEQGCFKSSGTVNCSVNNGGCAHNYIDECAQWGNNCPQICNNLKGSFKCACMTGFFESSYPFPRCKLFFVGLPTVYLTMGSEIRRFSPSKRKYSEVFTSHRPQALAFNTQHSTIYWTDSTLKSIHRAYVAETPGPAAKLYITGLQEPNGISVDWISGNIYWTDTAKKTISVAAYDGKYSRTLIRNGLRKPYAIVTNSNTGWMYWTDIDSDMPTIERAWMTGEKREVLINDRLAYPTGITIDYFMQNRVFWCDAKLNVIESIKPDGSDRVTVVSQGLQNPISLDVLEEYMYVLSQNSGKLLRMDKFGRGDNIILQSGLLLPRSVKVFHVLKSNQDAKSKCYYKTTCSHLCLLTPDGHTCACPDNSKLLPGSKTICDAALETSVELAHCVCKNGGTCVQAADNSYTCKCKAGFYGSDCTSVTPEKLLGQLKYTKVTAVVVPVVLLLIIAAVLLAGFFFMKKRGKFFLNKPLIGGPTVPHTPLGVVAYRDGENVQIGTPALSYEITPGQEVNPIEKESSSANPACPTNFSNPMYGVDPATKMEQHQKNESGSSEKPIVSAKKTAETKSTNENYYASLKTGRSFDPTEDTDKETAGLVKIGEL